ncbi:MAG TPA: UDP-N-acetylmuramoyl-L-alanine--D-glutamate ligase [Candidatus Saccharimonadales bacterium]|nr:UDP-N-acetylmuramoyl-L-alanine--D-glutamate ligase [Candidatus Saccharimonadales bacterium]
MKIAILGFGKQGRSAYEYWRGGNEITVCDGNEDIDLPDGVKRQLGPGHLKGLDEFDLIVRSPIVYPPDIVAANSPAILEKVTTVTNEFFKVCPTNNIVGVTGTKGKGTTSTLIAKMLEADGRTVHLGGNIGTPPLDMLRAGIGPDDWIVLELANFQLIDLKYSPHIGICLMVVPEHLDWHADSEEYFNAKRRMFEHQTEDDIAIFYAENEVSRRIGDAGRGRKIPYMEAPGAFVENEQIMIDGHAVCATSEVKLLGQHNLQNACAAVTAVWQIIQNAEAMRTVLGSFSGMEHRLELVRELGGVRYYNDSFGTTPETAMVAIQAFEEPKIVILGGSDKGADYTELAKVVAGANIRKVLLIGEQGARISEALAAAGVDNTMPGGNSIEEIVSTARAQASPGDVVLLSPACASFDMFKNYQDRGEKFKKAVLALD